MNSLHGNDLFDLVERASLAKAYETVIAHLSQEHVTRRDVLTQTTKEVTTPTRSNEPLGLRVQRRDRARRDLGKIDAVIAILSTRLKAIEQCQVQ